MYKKIQKRAQNTYATTTNGETLNTIRLGMCSSMCIKLYPTLFKSVQYFIMLEYLSNIYVYHDALLYIADIYASEVRGK